MAGRDAPLMTPFEHRMDGNQPACLCNARYSDAATTSSPALTADKAPSAYSRGQVNRRFGAIPR
jgi:hypothetical protein